MSATFFRVCFLSSKDSTCQTRKNVFYLTLKVFFGLEKIKFQNFRFSNFMTSSNAYAWNKKYILLNNLGSKHCPLMKFGQFMSYFKRNNFFKKFYKNCGLKTSSGPFFVCKEVSTTSIRKRNFWNNLLILDM